MDYTKGDEDGLLITPYALNETDGDDYQFQTWDATGALRTRVESQFSLTATGKYMMVFDVSGIELFKFTQIADGGTPTGTISASFVMEGS